MPHRVRHIVSEKAKSRGSILHPGRFVHQRDPFSAQRRTRARTLHKTAVVSARRQRVQSGRYCDKRWAENLVTNVYHWTVHSAIRTNAAGLHYGRRGSLVAPRRGTEGGRATSRGERVLPVVPDPSWLRPPAPNEPSLESGTFPLIGGLTDTDRSGKDSVVGHNLTELVR